MAYPTPHIEACQICGSQFEHGPHVYKGRHLARYKLLVCEACYSGNRDGWNPAIEPRLLAHLRAHNLSIPERNSKGLFPRGDKQD